VRTIGFYRTASGKCPVEEFLDSLPDRDAQKIAWVLRLIDRMDTVPQQYFKKLVGTEEVWEIRAQIGGNSYRMLGFFDSPTHLIVTNGFLKKREKTVRREIELAQRRRAEHFQRRK
jgi:phage-related protein